MCYTVDLIDLSKDLRCSAKSIVEIGLYVLSWKGMMLNKPIEFEGGAVTSLKQDVVLLEFKTDGKVTRDMVDTARKLKLDGMGSTVHATIIDCTDGISSFSAEAKSLIFTNIDPFDKNMLTVLLVTNGIQKIEANIFLKLNPSSDNIVIVKSLKDAMAAIDKQKLENKPLSVA